MPLRRLVLPFLCSLAAITPLQAAPEGIPLDEVWSGHPVSFALLTERGHQFAAYYDAQRRITVVGRRLDSDEWARIQPEGVSLPNRGRPSNVTGWDSHNYLTLALDRDGFIHLSGNLHNDPLIYYRSSKPLDVTSLERIDRMTGVRENNTTYPVFFKNANGDLLFRYRDGGSGNGSDIYNLYDTTTRTWRNLLSTALIDGQGQRNAYANQPTLGPDGRFHLVWMWRDTPDCSTNHTLSYARSSDFINWEKGDGTPITLPITLTNGDVVDAAPIRQGLINMTFNLGFDAKKRPVIVYHRYDAQGLSQAYAARRDEPSGPWVSRRISDWGFRWQFSGGGSITAEVTLGSATLRPSGNLTVDFATTHGTGEGRWELDPETLQVLGTLPAPEPLLPPELRDTTSPTRGMEVQTTLSRADGALWVLRWETLPRNRDRPRDFEPPPTRLMLYKLPEKDTVDAQRIGS